MGQRFILFVDKRKVYQAAFDYHIDVFKLPAQYGRVQPVQGGFAQCLRVIAQCVFGIGLGYASF